MYLQSLSRSMPGVGRCLGRVCDDGTCCTSPTGQPEDIVCCPDTINCAPEASDCPAMPLTWNMMAKNKTPASLTWNMMTRKARRVSTTNTDCSEGTSCDGPPGVPDCACCPNSAWCAGTLRDCTNTSLWSKMMVTRKKI